MQNRFLITTPAIVVLMLAGRLSAGGLWLQLGNPDASPEAQKLHAAVTVKAVGCENPTATKITGTAIGMVDGRQQSIVLKVMPISDPGLFAVMPQWPKEGVWVIHLQGDDNGRITSLLAKAGPEGVDRQHTQAEMRAFSSADIEAVLHGMGAIARK